MSDHRWADLAAAYALGSLEPSDRTDFESHLEGCVACRRDVDSYREVAAGLAAGAPRVEPPDALRARVLDRVSREAQPDRAETPDTVGQVAPARRETPIMRYVLVGTAAASLALAAVVTLMLQRSNLDRQSLARTLATAQLSLEERDSTITRQQTLLNTLLAPQLSTASLAAAAPQEPGLQLFWNRDSNLMVVAAFNLPPAPAGRTYQLWGISGGAAPVSLGLFDVPADDEPVTLTALASESFDLAAVTEEPASGSPQPTSTPFLVGTWNHGN